jgi:hypothetical protein
MFEIDHGARAAYEERAAASEPSSEDSAASTEASAKSS